MKQDGEYDIAAPREAVWDALNDPEVLQRCMPGCESMTRTSDTEFAAAVRAKIGPVNALFNANIELQDLDPPNSYRLVASAKGGAAGFGKGGAHVELLEQGEAQTQLRYTVDASVGGKLAQVGSRLVDGAARKMAEDFFARFRDELEGNAPAAGDEASAGTVAEAEAFQPSNQWWIWAVMFAVLLTALLLAF